MAASTSYRSTNLTRSIDERVLICNIHSCSLIKRTSPKHFDVASVHLSAGFFDLSGSIPNIAAQRDEDSMWQIRAIGERCLIGYTGTFRGYCLDNTRVRASDEF